jgi:curved DNA-binding protein CbpA
MDDPYGVLGLPADSDDEAIRRRYLELVKQYPPEQHPEQFARYRAAFDSLRDLDTRLKYRLFEAGQKTTVDGILEELVCQNPRRRLTLKEISSVLDP